MSSYESLASGYDLFTSDVDYVAWANYYESIFEKYGIDPELVLDLACGTGTLSLELAKRGYDMTAVDASADMLSVAISKADNCNCKRPLFLCQTMEELDLYGTYDAVVCALDSLNYLLSEELLTKAFDRLKFFVRPGGIVVFDLNTDAKFKTMNGNAYVRDEEGYFCVWSAEYSEETRICNMIMDIFCQKEGLWERSTEEHIERAHSDKEVESAIKHAGFKLLARYDDLSFRDADENSMRVFWVIERT